MILQFQSSDYDETCLVLFGIGDSRIFLTIQAVMVK